MVPDVVGTELGTDGVDGVDVVVDPELGDGLLPELGDGLLGSGLGSEGVSVVEGRSGTPVMMSSKVPPLHNCSIFPNPNWL